jgi:hypothetical protein
VSGGSLALIRMSIGRNEHVEIPWPEMDNGKDRNHNGDDFLLLVGELLHGKPPLG